MLAMKTQDNPKWEMEWKGMKGKKVESKIILDIRALKDNNRLSKIVLNIMIQTL